MLRHLPAGPGGHLGLLVVLGALSAPGLVRAHPEFQRSIVTLTHRSVNCAYCHTSADGPEGTALGQIGRLTAAELDQLGRARAALKPGSGVESPILNAFGNHILKSLGKARILELRLAPEQLAGALPAVGDMDHDGISDVQEYRDGTHPLLNSDGDPWRLFTFGFQRNAAQLALALCATILGLYGLRHLLQGFDIAARGPTDARSTDPELFQERDA